MAYTRTTWQTDDVITADKLNNIEEGIKSVEDNGLTIGTTASTAKAGNYHPTWSQVSGKPTTFAPIIGSTASTAAAGNHNHAVIAHTDSGLEAAANIQALAQALSARIKALEDPR